MGCPHLTATIVSLPPSDSRLKHYPAEVDAGDLFRHAPGHVAEKWETAANSLFGLAAQAGCSPAELLARQVQDMGFSFRLTGDVEERSWPLTPMPLIIGADEWAIVEKGLIQRADLLEQVIADIYGAQRLVEEGFLPAAVVTGSRWFAREMVGLKPGGAHYLHVYAVDLVRGPRGQWRVLADRLRLANGIGYALENRLALSRATGPMLSGIQARRMAGFFASLREGIARDAERASPRTALLTPGRFNQSYPEQAHLARYLGLPLVEGRDLIVTDGRLYVRTIAGPKRIDAIWRWIDTNALDPLRFDSRSTLGVPDLFDAWATGHLAMTNWPGVELLESPAFQAFLPTLCHRLTGEAPILPNVATWWCGQPREAELVRARLHELCIVPAFSEPAEGLPGSLPVAGASLSAKARAELLDAMDRRPMDYCGQEIVKLSTTPVLAGDGFEPRPFTIRAFVARGGDGQWMVMPGGFARIAASGALRSSLMGEGDLSADVCIVDPDAADDHLPTLFQAEPQIRRGGGILSSQAADNLFWFGRYMERAEATVRVLRSILGSAIDLDSVAVREAEIRDLLVDLLHRWDAIDEGMTGLPIPELCRAALHDSQRRGSVCTLMAMLRETGLTLRDRLAPDFWRLASQPLPDVPADRNEQQMLVRSLVERFGGLAGLIAEDMVRSPAWRFLEMGRRLERALAICRMVGQLNRATAQTDALSVMLDLCDSQITYRARYLAQPAKPAVLDLVLLDPDNPRSLQFQLDRLNAHIEALPPLDDSGLPEAPLLASRSIQAMVSGQVAKDIRADLLARMDDRLLALSDAITQRYFLHLERLDPRAGGQFLA